MGNFTDFIPFASHGLSSIGFPTIFPVSYRFSSFTSLSHCTDLRDGALAFNILVTCALFILFRPKPIVLYWSLVCIGFWHVVLFSQPQGPPPPIDVAFGSFLPALFVAYAFWRLAFRFVLPAFANAPLESCILYLSGFWVGVLNNLTFDKLPLSRLTSSDLSKRSGAVATLVVILVIVVACVINQIRVIRKTGWLPHYLMWYIFGGLVIMVLALLPGLSLRLHHYIIPMLVIPGTAFPTRLSAIYQGLMLGFFLNGVAAFGFAPIVQTPDDVRFTFVPGLLSFGSPRLCSSARMHLSGLTAPCLSRTQLLGTVTCLLQIKPSAGNRSPKAGTASHFWLTTSSDTLVMHSITHLNHWMQAFHTFSDSR